MNKYHQQNIKRMPDEKLRLELSLLSEILGIKS